MRLGRLGDVNAYPIYGAIDGGLVAVPASLVTANPAELGDRLVDGRLEVSVISAVAYARHAAALELLPDLAIGCDGPVHSVVLFSRRPPRRLGGARVLLSSASRTSVLLLELLARERWGVVFDATPVPAQPGDLERLAVVPHDAVLVIGDAALMLAARRAYPCATDLGAEWKAWTGLPFVFAVWAARRDAARGAVRAVHRALLASRRWGLLHRAELAGRAAAATGVTRDACEVYLRDLDYRMTRRHLAGLGDFLGRLSALGKMPGVPRSIGSAA